jgi:hypothetical protein
VQALARALRVTERSARPGGAAASCARCAGGVDPVMCQSQATGNVTFSGRCRSPPHAHRDRRPGYHGGEMCTEAVRFLVVWMAGWVNSRQLEVIDFLREENRVLREQLGGRRLRFTDDQRRRLAVKGRVVGRRRLGEFAGLVTPDTILRWYRELIARKYDGSARRRPGRPTVAFEVEQLVVQMATENPSWGGGTRGWLGRWITSAIRSAATPSSGSCFGTASSQHRRAASGCRGRPSSARTWARSPARTSSRSRCSR